MARNVFFSFDYDDVMAVNIVRNSDVVRVANVKRPFSDRSLYEAAKNTPGAIKRAIDGAVDGTSVTVVVTGEHTWRSYWVRYEIAKSLERGNGFIVVDIDGVGPPPTPSRGPNPLDNMMLAPSYDRTGFAIMEWDGSKYADYKSLNYVSNATAKYPASFLAGNAYALSQRFPLRQHWRLLQMSFPTTIEQAAREAGWNPAS